MSLKIQRAIVLLTAAAIALIVGAVNVSNDGPSVVSQVTGAVVFFGGIAGLVFLAWGLLRRDR